MYDGEYLTIVDRLKDIIIRGGENISAQEVESLLVTHPDVAEAACVAMPDPVMGEKVCAFVIARDGTPRRRSTTCARTSSRTGLARFKLPERLEVRDRRCRAPRAGRCRRRRCARSSGSG